MKNVALIPARGGSKRLPGKNLVDLNGKPLIALTIEICSKVKGIDRVIVSTDDEQIADVARKYGAEIPFIRPAEFASDTSGDRDVMLHLIKWLKEAENYDFDNLLYMRPTTPFKTETLISDALEKISNAQFSSVRSVTKSTGVFHPYWMFKSENELLKPFIPGITYQKYYQSQLLPPCFRLNGVVDILRVGAVKSSSNIYGDSIGYVEVEEVLAIDIDTEFDLLLCRFIIERGLV